MLLVLHNVRMVLSNVRKKIREQQNVTKVQSHVMLVLHNVRTVPSNVRKNNKTTKCDKSTSHVMLNLHNVRMVPLNVRKKNKGIIECDKSTVITHM